METEEIKKIIADQQKEIETLFKKERIIDRDLDYKALKHFLSHPNILAITGVRRSGKSILAASLLRGEKYGHLNFDDERLAGFGVEDFNKVLQAFYELYGADINYLIFDEIQNIETKYWELFLNRLRRTKKIVITGSNANLLTGELATHLTGRHIDFTLYPFSFKEFLRLRNVDITKESVYSTQEISRIKSMLQQYIKLGGLPEVYNFGSSIIRDTYGDIINRDIFGRFKIRHRKSFKEMAKYLISNFGQEVSYSKLQRVFSIKDIHTVKNYVDYLSSAFVVFVVERFSYKLKEQTIAPKKIYCIDTGLVNVLSFQFSKNIGKLIENVVFLQLVRRSSYSKDGLELYYWKDHQQREADFVLKKGIKVIQLIQVCYDVESMQIREREINSLLLASEELSCSNLLVITWDEERVEKVKGQKIKFIPLWKWLLTDSA